MLRRAVRFLTLLAMILMPFGMTASAAPPQQAAEAMLEHCADKSPASKAHSDGGECTMVCSAALPAAESGTAAAPAMVLPPLHSAAIVAPAGIELEIATPPPRSA